MVIKMLTSPSRGANQQILLDVVDSITVSRILFGCEVFFDTAKNNIKALHSVYSAGVRSAIGAFRTSPIPSLMFESSKLSLEHLILRKNINYCLRVMANGLLDEYSVSQRSSATNRRTIGDFFQDHISKLEIDLSQIIRGKSGQNQHHGNLEICQ